MEQGKTVFEGQSKHGKNILIRYIQNSDAAILCTYINTLSQERTFLRFQGEQITLEDETTYINAQVKRMNEYRTVHLVAICDNAIIGVAGLDMKDKAENHVGEFGISIAQAYRNEGIGTLLMKSVLKEAEVNIPELKIIILDVFSNNVVAQAMYKKFGFIEYGRLPNAYLHDTVYVDSVKMYKNVLR